jgi:(1->4)-alpha-D-glucan 1-alpha-D-glucosylmutase
VDSILSSHPFLTDFGDFFESVAQAAMLNSLAQTVIKVASPGVPDFYQGSELWDYSLVDPDNRRPVDYEQRRNFLRGIDEGQMSFAELLAQWRDGRAKMWVTAASLRLRRANRALFLEGDYVPLHAMGGMRNNVIAFARLYRGSAALAVTGRFFRNLEGGWTGTMLALPRALTRGPWRDVLSGRSFDNLDRRTGLEEPFAIAPVVLLVREQAG